MIFQIGENKAIITEKGFKLLKGDMEMISQDFASMISYSIYRPFEIEKKDWILADFKEENQKATATLKTEEVDAVLAFEAQDYLSMILTFKNTGSEEMVDFAGSLSLPITGKGANKVTIPHMIYNDNPSANPDKIVPHLGNTPGEGLIVEEHRLPIPAVNVEWEQDGACSYVTMFSKPEVITGDEREYWSIGVLKAEDGDVITAFTGPLMFNGYKDSVYGGRCTPLSYQKGYRYLQPDEAVSKTYLLDWGTTEVGKGFRSIVKMGYEILKPETVAQHTPEEMVDFKKNVLDSRYYKDETCCGYQCFGSANAFGNISGRPEYFLYGWTGQTIKLAWCDCVLGLKTEEAFRFDRGMEIVDFFVRNGQHKDFPGLFYGYYLVEMQEWRGAWKEANASLASRIEGESLSDLIDLMTFIRENGKAVPAHWEEAVKNACAFLMDEKYQTKDGIYPLAWEQDGTIKNDMVNASGMPCVMALTKAAEYFDEDAYLEYAKAKYQIYYHLHMETFDVPFARATMDAQCEDKEAGLYFFETAAELYRITGEEKYKEWAAIAADWILTFVFFWETGFAPKTVCKEKGFKTTGWPGVSVQNHHLDVFFPSYDLYAFGKRSGLKLYEEMGKHISDALTYGVCTKEGEWGFSVIGEQGEHYYHTNYFQARYPSALKHMGRWRGGNNPWNPSWITAQVMSAAIKFAELDQ